jgi:hypothetical protein
LLFPPNCRSLLICDAASVLVAFPSPYHPASACEHSGLSQLSLRGTNSRTSKKTSALTTKSLSSPDEVVLIQERIAFKSLCASLQTRPSRNDRAPSDRILRAEIRHRTGRPSRGPRTTVGTLPRTWARPSGRPQAGVKPIPRGQSR